MRLPRLLTEDVERRTLSMEYWTIEVLAGELSALRWRDAYGDALVEAAHTNVVIDWRWALQPWGVALELGFADEGHLADALLSYFEIAITQATEVYLENANLSGAADERGRRDVLSDLLAGRPVLHGRLAATAGAHGLDGDGPFLVVSGGVPDGEDEPGPLRAAARTLADAVAGNHPPLAVGRHDEIVVIANVESRSRPFGPSLERARRTLASHGLHVAIGASAVVDSLVDLPAAYDEALTARARAAESTGVLVVADLTLFGFLTLQRDATAQRLVDDRVRTFVAEDTAAGGTLLETLVAFVTCDLNVRRVADQLHVHVNTAHYRLDRIASRTGRDLRHIPDLFELLTAVRLLRPDLGRQG